MSAVASSGGPSPPDDVVWEPVGTTRSSEAPAAAHDDVARQVSDAARERRVEARVQGMLDDFRRGPIGPRRGTSAPGREPPSLVLTARPSPVVALDIPLKVAGAVLVVLLPVLVGAIIGGATGDLDSVWLGAGGVALFGINLFPAVIAAAIPSVMVLFTTYRIDERGIQSRTQLLSKNVKTVPWGKVTALIERRTLFDRVFGLHRLQVIAYGERGARLQLVGLRADRVWRDRIARGMQEATTMKGLFDND